MKTKKIVFTKPWAVEVIQDDLNEKELLPGEVIIRNEYSLISAGTEMACLSGTEDWFKFPSSPGYLSVGEVIDTGKDVQGMKKGDMIVIHGPHSEYFRRDSNDAQWVKLPEGVKHDEACFTLLGAVSMTALRVSDIEIGDYVAVTGMGIVGNIAAQLAQIQGGTAIAIDLSEKRLKIAQDCGIKHILKMDRKTMKSKVTEITGGRGVFSLIESSGAPAVITEITEIVIGGGEVILLGTPRGEYKADITPVLRQIAMGGTTTVTYKGAFNYRFPMKQDFYLKHSQERNCSIILDLIKGKKLDVKPLITQVLKPEEAPKGYDGLKNKKDEFIGVIFDWRK